MHSRRDFLRTGAAGAGALAFGPAFWSDAFAATVQSGSGPYGPLGPPDANNLMLPAGFKSRVVARGGAPVEGTDYTWHIFSDGASTFETKGGGWILVSNSEAPAAPGLPLAGEGGASAIRFASDGRIEAAYRILGGTRNNCAGGPTPWGTWLSCEEIDDGQVWECDPAGKKSARVRPALGVFKHEAACVDPGDSRVYLTEDLGEGGFYRFTPDTPGDLGAGRLEIAKVLGSGRVKWKQVPDPSAKSTPTREQVPGTTRFMRGEGIWFDSGIVYIATTTDSRIHAYNTRTGKIRILYDAATLESPPLTDVDNLTVSRSGDLFVCEDNGGDDPFDVAIITPKPDRQVARFVKAVGPEQGNSDTQAASELTGVCFNPRGDRMYFASQRAFGTGVVYEVSGPFRTKAPDGRSDSDGGGGGGSRPGNGNGNGNGNSPGGGRPGEGGSRDGRDRRRGGRPIG